MPAEVNGNHVVAQFQRARVFVKDEDTYYACGSVVLTPFFAFVSGHHGLSGDYDVLVSHAIPRENVTLIDDQSTEVCETHDEMDAEAKAQMESHEESKED